MIDPAYNRYAKQLAAFSKQIRQGHEMRDALRAANRTRGLTGMESGQLRALDRWLEELRACLS